MRKALMFAAATAALAAAVTTAGPVFAHHSFAVYFDDTKTVELTGTVSAFHFRNPHGTIELTTTAAEGQEAGQQWKVETNAPVILRRRGWDRDSLTAGQVIHVTGWPSRDGSHYMRMQQVTDTDGVLIGAAPFTPNDD